ncbi:hypothetical protein LTR91_006783 [Friedmanniomyces endolithicus]|uniref:Calpain catalytic domain-containing protein n=1 Tax=Friedmanniomyces endolithicus TaxID=329885 RepID=A0AAN6KQR0_9PEZI|nr:hypothetical protein LTR94_011980 [Friedmanniomyces endolithicus]KAK0783891.1 hypothetical protein LTR59_011602 [Friedmanniomyces endolithicus]KAK0790282.1 hypothetical protein LTR38_010670 [Friedmanniomyces endolithicus]KAK0837968.1 hypothetical protein LTR03_012365 [Friedmanniomyces endolithicus]KAK0841274.1 hypothetical protein LTS02_016903 [Friedmanniomyces endolithicus]
MSLHPAAAIAVRALGPLLAHSGLRSYTKECLFGLLEKNGEPLLEEAFAKAHGHYSAVEEGFVGDAIEDLTGRVTSELHGTDILDRDAIWINELLQVNTLFLLGCGQSRGLDNDRNGIQHRHAYSIMEAKEVDGLRLVKLRNPWAITESRAMDEGEESGSPAVDRAFENETEAECNSSAFNAAARGSPPARDSTGWQA